MASVTLDIIVRYNFVQIMTESSLPIAGQFSDAEDEKLIMIDLLPELVLVLMSLLFSLQ